MRFTKKDLHPSVFEAVNTWQSRIMYNLGQTGQTGQGPSLMDIYNKHQKVWWKEYGKAFGLWSAIYTVSFFGAMVLLGRNRDITFLWLVLAVGIAAIVHSVIGYKNNKEKITAGELEALLPGLDLTEIQREYCTCFLHLVRSQSVEDDHRKEILSQLNQLLDEYERLKQQRELLRERAGAFEQLEKLKGEIEQMTTRMNTTTDADAKDTFAKSIEIAEGRMNRQLKSAPMVERVDAQIALVNQTMGAFTEVLARLKQSDRDGAPELSTLRARIAEVASHSSALESAFDELTEIGVRV
jgi:hypothetical protein